MTLLDLIPSGGASVGDRSDRVRMGGGRAPGRDEIDAAERDYLCRERWLDEGYEEIEEESW